MMDLSCGTCTGGTSGGGRNQDVWLREPPQFRTLVRRAHATPGRSAGPHGDPAARALASKHGAGRLRLPEAACAHETGEEACDSLLPEAGEAACACDSESDSLPPDGEALTPHHDWLRASKHRTEPQRHDATALTTGPFCHCPACLTPMSAARRVLQVAQGQGQ